MKDISNETGKKRPGRPKSENPRNKGIRVLLTSDELKKLHEIADRNMETVSDYIRRRVLGT